MIFALLIIQRIQYLHSIKEQNLYLLTLIHK